MAKAIATVGGVAIAPGVSLNRRLYTRPMLARAVAKMQGQLAAGETIPLVDRRDLTNLTHHDAGDDTTKIVGRVTAVSLGEGGEVRYKAAIADTTAGRDIAALVDTSDGQPPFLRGVSIRGAWAGKVRRVTADDGKPAETADDLDLDGWDYTATPGVRAAGVDTFAWASDGQQETTERVLITESVQEARVTFTEETTGDGAGQETAPAGPPEGVREALAAFLGESGHHVLVNGECATCAQVGEATATKKPYGDVPYADPGYLDTDGQQASSSGKPGVKRYPLDKKHIRPAWTYINQAKNAGQYTAAQLKRIKGRIKAAMKSIGAKVSAETAGWVISEPRQVTEAIAEWYGDPATKGSWSISASNGPVNLSLSSWSMDPADLDVILRAAADAACAALARLDPDMDGDVDVDGVGDNSDTDGDAGESARDDPAVTEDGPGDNSAEADTDPADAGTEEGDPAMGDQTSTETGGAAPAGLSPELAALLSEAVKNGIEAGIKAATPAPPAATETAPAATGTTEGTKETTVAETDEQKIERLVAEKLAAAGVKPPVAETEEQRVARLVEERLAAAGVKPPVQETEEQRIDRMLTERVQALVSDGSISVHRAGIVVEHTAPDPDQALDAKALAAMDEDSFIDTYAGPALDKHVASRTRIPAVHA